MGKVCFDTVYLRGNGHFMFEDVGEFCSTREFLSKGCTLRSSGLDISHIFHKLDRKGQMNYGQLYTILGQDLTGLRGCLAISAISDTVGRRLHNIDSAWLIEIV